MNSLLIAGGYLVDPSQGWEGLGDILVEEGRVAWVGVGPPPAPPGAALLASGLMVAPGFIDLHTHLREPGEEDKETISTALQAAARGGFTALCAMPNTHPPADSAAVIEWVQQRAKAQGSVRVFPVGCVSQGRRGEALAPLTELARAGAVAFSDDGSPVADPSLMRHAMDYSLPLGLPLMEHPEDPHLSQGGVMNEGIISLRLGLRGIPAQAEEVAVARNIALAELTGARLHLCHLSTAGAVELVRRAKERGLPVTAEVTPHHLTLTEERVMEAGGYDTNAKMNPPLRTERDRQALLQGLREGVIDAIATDHAPHTLADKLQEFDYAPFGISGLETALSALLSLVRREELALPTLIARLTVGPAGILRKELGTLKPGSPADIVLFDPRREWAVEAGALASKGKNTPFLGEKLQGKVVATLVAGKIIYKEAGVRLESREPQQVRR